MWLITYDVQVWEMHALLAEGVRSGEVEPLPWTVFSAAKVQDAFRYLASGAPRKTLKPCIISTHVTHAPAGMPCTVVLQTCTPWVA